MYQCTLSEVVTEESTTYFRIYVYHNSKKDYLDLHKQPTDIFYMAYFLDNNLCVNLHENGQLDYISISVLRASTHF